jgi:hypothetical protein
MRRAFAAPVTEVTASRISSSTTPLAELFERWHGNSHIGSAVVDAMRHERA